MQLAGKVALITGAGGGIGSAAARLFAENGAQVWLGDIAEERTRAERAITDEARSRHRELAKMFATKAAQRSEEQYANG